MNGVERSTHIFIVVNARMYVCTQTRRRAEEEARMELFKRCHTSEVRYEQTRYDTIVLRLHVVWRDYVCTRTSMRTKENMCIMRR